MPYCTDVLRVPNAALRFRPTPPLGPDELLVVSSTVPIEHVRRSPREVVVRFADRPELRADAKRTFRYLVNEDAGCVDATQLDLVGGIDGRAALDGRHPGVPAGAASVGNEDRTTHGFGFPTPPTKHFFTATIRLTASLPPRPPARLGVGRGQKIQFAVKVFQQAVERRVEAVFLVAALVVQHARLQPRHRLQPERPHLSFLCARL